MSNVLQKGVSVKIESGHDNRCVARAIRTAQLALGDSWDNLPDIDKPPLCHFGWVSRVLSEQFPNRRIKIWNKEATGFRYLPNIDYMDSSLDCFSDGTFDDQGHLVMFVYSHENTGHMVIGLPTMSYPIEIKFVAAIDARVEISTPKETT